MHKQFETVLQKLQLEHVDPEDRAKAREIFNAGVDYAEHRLDEEQVELALAVAALDS